MSSLWGFDTRASDDGNQSVAFYHADASGFDVGGVLAATRNELPLYEPGRLTHDTFLGSGTTFDVYRATYRHPGPTPAWYVAVKYVKLAAHSEEANRQRLRNVIREIRVMMQPALRHHKCIIPLLAYGWRNDPLLGTIPYIVTEYSAHGTLRAWLQRIDQTAGERQDLAMDVAIGIQLLHSEGIIHGDVKLENVLVYGSSGPNLYGDDPDYVRQWERNQIAKLADFGSVTFAGSDVSSYSYPGTPVYNAPELQGWVHSESQSSGLTFEGCLKADVYSFGLALWEVMNKGTPYYRAIPDYDEAEGALDLLKRLYQPRSNELREYAKRWATVHSLLHPQDFWSSTIKNAVRNALELCLSDAAARRADIAAVISSLGSGTSAKRQVPIYPLPTESPYIENDRVGPERPPPPFGYYVRSELPDIAVPNNNIKSPFLRKYNTLSGQWDLTTETDRDFALNELHQRYPPESVGQSWYNPQTLDLFETARNDTLPWDVQCEAIKKLKEDVLRETSPEKQARAHLQLSLCYHIGFGVVPDASKTSHHLQQAALRGSTIGAAMAAPVEAALRNLDTGPSIASMSLKSTTEIRSYIERVRQCIKARQEASLSKTIPSSAAQDCPRVPKVVQAMVEACQKGSYQAAFDLAKTSTNHLAATWSCMWPTPVHWLFMFEPEQARQILDLLLTGTSMSAFEHSPQDTVFIPELALELVGTPLMWAVRLGDLQLCTLLIDCGADIHRTWRRDMRVNVDDGALHRDSLHYSSADLAAVWHHAEVLELLLDRGAKMHQEGYYETHFAGSLVGSPVRPLARHATHGANIKVALLKTLEVLEGNCNNEDREWRDAALGNAFHHCDQEHYILEVLLCHAQFKRKLPGQYLIEAVKYASIRRCSVARLNLALLHVEDVKFVDPTGKTAMQYAAEANSTMMVERLLSDSRIDFNATDSRLPHPIALAAQAGAEGVVHLLADAGAHLDGPDRDGNTPLQHALASRQAMMAAILINAGARLKFTSSTGTQTNALLLGTSNENDTGSVLAALVSACPELRKKEILDHSDNDGWTATHQATWFGDLDGVLALLDAGADPSPSSKRGLPSKRRTGTPLRMVLQLSDDLKGLGNNGWKQSSIAWLANAGVVAWKSYLGRLESIIGALQGADAT